MSDRGVRRLAWLSGLAGSACLAIYFGAPAFLGWPFAGASPDVLSTYATSHESLFSVGAWFQATGTLLSIVFFLALVRLAGSQTRLSGMLTVASSTSLLAVVLVEAAFMMAVPVAAKAGDTASLVTAFAMSNGAFVRVFAMAPASATYIALGLALRGTSILDQRFATASIWLGGLFEIAGVVALFAQAGVIVVIVLSVAQMLWVIAASIALARSRAGAG